MKTSNEGKKMIKKFEGCVLTNYKDVGGNFTIGYGHVTNNPNYSSITQEKANELFEGDIKIAETGVDRFMQIYNFNQNQYDALVSFTFNCGVGNLNKLTANGQRTIEQISEMITAYNKCNGKIISGLVARRLKEKALFDTPLKTEREDTLTPSKICLNISKRYLKTNATPTYLLNYTFDCFILSNKFEVYGTGNLDACGNTCCELCLLENKETGRIELCYIPCDNLRC